MKHLFSLLLALLVCLLSAAFAEAADLQVVTPAGYEDAANRNYPVIYLLPRDGYTADDSELEALLTEQMAAKLGTAMIVVKPAFTSESDVVADMNAIIAQVDAQYRTVASPECRVAMGTGVGGYLAYALLLADDSPFGAAVSIRGDFASDDNPWLSTFGGVYEKLTPEFLETVYTYMDAPVDDPWTDMPGSTDDLGARVIEFGTGSAAHEFTVRPGAYDEAFAAESIRRVLNRLTTRMLSGMVMGDVALEKTTLTADDPQAVALCTVNIFEGIAAFAEGELPMTIIAALVDTDTGETLSEGSAALTATGAGTYTEAIALDNRVNGSSATVALSVELLDTPIELATATLILAQAPVIDGDLQQIELLGDWRFQYVGTDTVLDVAALTADEYEDWPIVQPGLAWWKKSFGNISDENVTSGYSPDYFDYFITGSGYYVKAFDIPEGFDASTFVLSIGYVDDRCEVFVNGQRVGATGMDDEGQPTGDTTWAVFSHFEIDPSILNIGGENTVVVRAWNDLPFGAGGWYAGPIGLYSEAAFEAQYGEGVNPRFYEETFESAHAAKANGQEGTIENQYLIYLPEGYETSDRYYPTVYLLHQFNSDHTSYRTDHVDALLDQGIATGLFDEMIVVIPNSSEESWWTGDWESMITEELIPLIETKYRAIPDARYRLTAGCSMGGQGAYAVALRNPDTFTGAVSFFGAFSYGGENSPNAIAEKESAEYFRNYALYFICGNQDSYGFGMPAIKLHQRLAALGVEHGFFIENGGHDSAFYVPRFQQGLAYARAHMYHSDDAMAALLTGTLTVEGDKLNVTLNAAPEIAAYLYAAPASSYTKLGVQPLRAPMLVEFVQNGDTVATFTDHEVAITADGLNYEADFTFDNIEADTVVLKVALLDQIVTLATSAIQ